MDRRDLRARATAGSRSPTNASPSPTARSAAAPTWSSRTASGTPHCHGVDALLDVPLLAHQCDNPLCQNPRCWRESNHRANGQDYGRRRDIVRGALADTRGARGRARAVRDAARDGAEISEAVLAGLRPVHLHQIELFPDERITARENPALL